MVCKECGKEITDETLGYCPECLAPLEEPVVISMSKEDIKKANKDLEKKEKEIQKNIEVVRVKQKEDLHLNEKYEGPFIDLIGYVKSLGKNFINLLILVGAALIYASPFLPWIWEKLHGVYRKGNLFEMAAKDSDMALGNKTMAVMGVLLLISGFLMLLISAREHIKSLWKIRYNFIVRLIPVVTSALAFFVVFKNKSYSNAFKAMKELKDMAKSLGHSSVYSYGKGIGPILCVAGIGVYVLATIFDFIHYQKNKE
ncbi:MAG: hypothetical protein IJ224_04200 [Lachnospiraceae bacterium]|nr:hypothetical protein [Lachnospiraceae bacterium]